MTEVVWVAREVVLAIHDEQIAEHGGLSGIRDLALLASTLDRPRNRAAYGDADLANLAAAYGFGIARNHPFNDGNKRVSAVVTELFLALNGLALTASDQELVETWTALASGLLSEDALAAWLRAHASEPMRPSPCVRAHVRDDAAE